MRFKLENIGPIQRGELELGRLTIICGRNNSGKTYASYSIYSFLDSLFYHMNILQSAQYVDELIENKRIEIDIDDISATVCAQVNEASKKYSRLMFESFSSSEDDFVGSQFEAVVGVEEISFENGAEYYYMSNKKKNYGCYKK